MIEPDTDLLPLDYIDVCVRIDKLTSAMMSFWKDSHGWAPAEAAGLLNRSMLEWQASLAGCLQRWLTLTSPGELILAWVNLGALIEGQLKLFLCVYYDDYKSDAHAIQKKGRLQNPDGCMLEQLREFFAKRIWDIGTDWSPWLHYIQLRRNSIHAYKFRDIGTHSEWKNDLKIYLSFLRDMNSRLPYPDDIWTPRER
jgi:hypothetical protein